jgi:hypothetical protein
VIHVIRISEDTYDADRYYSLADRICAVVVVFLPGLAGAQSCADALEPYTLECDFGTCHSLVNVTNVIEGFDIEYACHSQTCCGQLFSVCQTTSGNCGDIREPGMRRRIAQVAEESRVLVADCRGRFKLFQAAPDATLRDMTPYLDDRLLRW